MKKQNHIIYGIHAIIEAINSGKSIEKIILKQNFKSQLIQQLRNLATKNNIPIQYVPQEKINALFPYRSHQGAYAIISPIKFWDFDELVTRIYENGQNPLLIMLDRVTDVRNFGAIVRTAECAGANAVIIPTKHTAQISGDAFKTSAGALYHLPIVRSAKLLEIIKKAKLYGIQIIAATEKTDNLIYNIDFTKPSLIIMGSEATGISPNLLKTADTHAKIPQFGKIESLNVSVAAALFIYEAVRQRHFNPASNP